MTTLHMPWVSALTAGVLLVLQMLLMLSAALNRGRSRRAAGGDGDNGDPELTRRVRRHGNLAENAAIFVAGYTLLELLGENQQRLEIACGVFVLARLLHAIGFSFRNTANLARVSGVILTLGSGLYLGARLVQIAVMHLCPVIGGL